MIVVEPQGMVSTWLWWSQYGTIEDGLGVSCGRCGTINDDIDVTVDDTVMSLIVIWTLRCCGRWETKADELKISWFHFVQSLAMSHAPTPSRQV